MIKLSNHSETIDADSQSKNVNKSIKIPPKAVKNKMKTSGAIYKILSPTLSES